MSLCASRLFSIDKVEKMIFTPKIFSRILLLPIYVNDFIVDVEKTTSTAAGKKALEYAHSAGMVDSYKSNSEIRLRHKNSNTNNVTAVNYFATFDMGD